MGYVKKSLASGEKIVGFAKIHWSVWISAILGYMFWLAVYGALYINRVRLVEGVIEAGELDADGDSISEYLGYFVALVFALTCIRFAWYLSLLRSTEYAVTSRRLIAKHGIIGRVTVEMQLRKIESLHIKQGLLGRIFASGRVIATGTGGTVRPWRTISRPLRFKQKIEQAIGAIESA